MADGCSQCCLLILAIFWPPLAVGLWVGCTGAFWLNWLLTIFFYFPGLIHAWIVICTRRPYHDHCHDHVVVVQQPATTTVTYTTTPADQYQAPVSYQHGAQYPTAAPVAAPQPAYMPQQQPAAPPAYQPPQPSSAYPDLNQPSAPQEKGGAPHY
ncbi:hypothetical protein PMAYCL1PPCAC_03561 [Pristionchus mayeri]|uniref:Uncharacterized protein n=1 Tax=Pristionchus mayeri TaxID=1317129 RepID=A0AAN5C9P4_9BILA|nr:hypothetical protein PMAYCL1PPCAC_03561 [Pristionchus mayeri]